MPDKEPISHTSAALTDAAKQALMLRDTLVYLAYEPTAWGDIKEAAQAYNVTHASTMLQSAAEILRYAAERIAARAVPAPQASAEGDGVAKASTTSRETPGEHAESSSSKGKGDV